VRKRSGNIDYAEEPNTLRISKPIDMAKSDGETTTGVIIKGRYG
jgi:hypothetical protein